LNREKLMSLKNTLAVLACSVALPLMAEDVTVQSYASDVTVAATPETVVVLDVHAVDSLLALGVDIAGAPENLYVDYLADVDTASVGTLFEPDYEAMAQLAPDLIVAGGRSSRVVDQLSEIAPTVDMTIWGDDAIYGDDLPAQAKARIMALAEITGTQDRGAALSADIDAALALAQAAVAGKGNALIVLTNGTTVSAYGAGSRFGWLHKALSLPEAVEGVDAQTHGEAVSFEFIAEANPDWLLVIDRGAAIGQDGESAAATLDNALIAGTTAAQNDQIVYLNAANIYIAGGGFTSLTSTLAELTTAFGG
jgi:iron complex transport system substrate-binding protein